MRIIVKEARSIIDEIEDAITDDPEQRAVITMKNGKNYIAEWTTIESWSGSKDYIIVYNKNDILLQIDIFDIVNIEARGDDPVRID